MPAPLTAVDVTIAVGQSLSTEAISNGGKLVGVFIPAATEGTGLIISAAPVSGGTFLAVTDSAGAVVEASAIAAGEYVAFGTTNLYELYAPVFKVQTSNGAGTPVVQAGAIATLTLIFQHTR